MNNMHCNCNHNVEPLHTVKNTQGTKRMWQRSIDFIKMAIPAFVFVIIPKCPVCLAGYVALVSGVGISLTTATYVRFGLIIFCVVSLTYFVIKHVRRWLMNS